jgi:pimeloyl-ACP methyl ester carboxylesterase
MSAFTVTNEQMLLKFGHVLAGVNVRAFEAAEERARLICFHGFVGNARDFDPLARFLATNGVSVVAADMYGRGDSAHFTTPGQYTLRRVVQAAAAVLDKYGQDATILGTGWGGLIALLGLAVARTRLRSFIAVDLRLDFSIDDDPVIAQALTDRGAAFATAQAAIAHVRNSPEFSALPEGADVGNRIRAEGAGYRLSHDDAITQRTQYFGGRHYDLRAMLAQLRTDALLLHAGPAPLEPIPRLTAIGELCSRGPLLLRSPAEQYLILGYLLARRPG